MKCIQNTGIALLLLLFLACTSNDAPLTRLDKVWIDSVYRERAKKLIIQEDSVCLAHRDSIFKINFDSILQKRISEREKIIYKIKSNL